MTSGRRLHAGSIETGRYPIEIPVPLWKELTTLLYDCRVKAEPTVIERIRPINIQVRHVIELTTVRPVWTWGRSAPVVLGTPSKTDPEKGPFDQCARDLATKENVIRSILNLELSADECTEGECIELHEEPLFRNRLLKV